MDQSNENDGQAWLSFPTEERFKSKQRELARATELQLRKKKHYLNEAKKANKIIPHPKFVKKKTVVWHGDTVTGSWITVMQLCHAGSVIFNYGVRGVRGKRVMGFVGMMDDNTYDVIPRKSMQIFKPCMAKQGLHRTAKACVATQLTEPMFDGKYVRVRWDSTSDEQWLYTHQIEETTSKKRKIKPPQRWSPGRKGRGGEGQITPGRNPFGKVWKKQYATAGKIMGGG